MIHEFIEVAKLKCGKRAGCEPFRPLRIEWVLDLDSDGKHLDLTATTRSAFNKKGIRTFDQRGKEFREVPANYSFQRRKAKNGGWEVMTVGRSQHTWLPDFLLGPVDELFPSGVRGGKNPKPDYHQATMDLLRLAKRQCPQNRIVTAILSFLDSNPSFPTIASKAGAELDWFDGQQAEIVTFRVAGKLAFTDAELRRWWATRAAIERLQVARLLISKYGLQRDAYLRGRGATVANFPTVKIGSPRAFASFDKAPFRSYGLGEQTATMRLRTAEMVAGGLNWLLSHDDHRLNLGSGEIVVFWAVRQPDPKLITLPFVRRVTEPDPLAVRDFLQSVWATRLKPIDLAQFHAATFYPAGKGRFSVRSWHTQTLADAQRHLETWFTAIDLGGEEGGASLDSLARSTIAQGTRADPPPAVFAALFEAALFGLRLPYHLFAAAISRQKTELAKGVDKKGESTFNQRLQARTALIQLFFSLKQLTGETRMNHETVLDPKCDHPAILCGRLLALLDKIHNEAHTTRNAEGKTVSKGTASSPAGRYYAAASATPALAFPQLLKLARYHLDKIGSGWSYRLEYGWRADENGGPFDALAAVVDRLKKAACGSFPRLLSLEDQGRFALGFYHERCRKWPTKTDSDNQLETSTPTP